MRIVLVLLFVTLITGCTEEPKQEMTSSSASWAFEKMITWHGNVYVATSEQVDRVGKKIGTIEHYSDQESASNPNNFSNYFKKGTALYSIPNVDTNQAICVEDSENHHDIKAVNEKLLNHSN